MRALGTTVLAALVAACGAVEVERLSLTDTRLPLEARRWLADAEDEVAIAKARVDDARRDLKALRRYRESLHERLEENWVATSGAAKGQGKSAADAFFSYADERVKMAEYNLQAAQKELQLAIARLTQARAETAIRYDVKVYEMALIVEEVTLLRNDVAKLRRQVEDQRVVVEQKAGEVWVAFAQFVQRGGVTNALWELPKREM